MNVFIDTELWSFSFKKPDIKNFSSKEEFKKALKLHTESDNFLQEHIKNNRIFMTFHQLSEIYHVLGFRGKKMSKNQVENLCLKLLDGKFIKWFTIERIHINEAIKISAKSNIHIWDYLYILPLIEEVNVIFTCDKHFLNASFQALHNNIVNPLSKWMFI
jgi:hypothetical protein